MPFISTTLANVQFLDWAWKKYDKHIAQKLNHNSFLFCMQLFSTIIYKTLRDLSYKYFQRSVNTCSIAIHHYWTSSVLHSNHINRLTRDYNSLRHTSWSLARSLLCCESVPQDDICQSIKTSATKKQRTRTNRFWSN